MRGRVSVSRLKARLSEYLNAVRNGETVVVTDRGKPVAVVEPLTAAEDWGAVVDRLVAAGLARRAVRPLPDDFYAGPPVADPDGKVLSYLLAERSSGG
jgi:prevent-host-death family protein